MNLRAAFVLSLVISTPLFAQIPENLPTSNSEAQATVQSPPAAEETETAEPARKLRIISEGQTLNFIAKFDGSGPTGLTDSIMFESNGKIGIGTTDPKGLFHLYSGPASDVAIGLGTDPSYLGGGPAMNVGYAGASYGRGAGFFNVRPDASAIAPNPSLRFSTADVPRMIITNTGTVGIGTMAPDQTYKLHILDTSNIATVAEVQNTSTGLDAAATLRTRSDLASTSYIAHGSGRTALSRFGKVVAGWSEILTFGGNGLMIGTNHSAPVLFGTTALERMRIHPSGDVTIGIPASGVVSPLGKLTVDNATAGGVGLNVTQSSAVASSGQNDTAFKSIVRQWVPSGVTALGMNSGWSQAWQTGPGTATWATAGYFQAGNTGAGGTVQNAFAIQAQVLKGSGTVINGTGVYIHDVEAVNAYGLQQLGSDDSNVLRGKVLIGPDYVPPTSPNILSVNGNAHFNGTVTGTNIKAHYQDFAEWVPATSDMTPGTVVVLNLDKTNEVMPSSRQYDTAVAGVVSEQPGIILGIEGDDKEQIATTGRVRVRVDARTIPIKVGDLLVTSDIPGTAMRSEPMDLNGRKFHQPGTIIGKALEPLAGGVGEILVLLSMQ